MYFEEYENNKCSAVKWVVNEFIFKESDECWSSSWFALIMKISSSQYRPSCNQLRIWINHQPLDFQMNTSRWPNLDLTWFIFDWQDFPFFFTPKQTNDDGNG